MEDTPTPTPTPTPSPPPPPSHSHSSSSASAQLNKLEHELEDVGHKLKKRLFGTFEKRVRLLHAGIAFVFLIFAILFFLADRIKKQPPMSRPFVVRSVPLVTSKNGATVPTYVDALQVDITILIAVMFAIGFLTHTFYAVDPKHLFTHSVHLGSNPFRWLEYAITGSLLILIIALLVKITDATVLLLLVVLFAIAMLLCGIVERRLRERVIRASIIPMGLAWLAVTVVAAVIVLSYIEANKSAKDNNIELPTFIMAILIMEMASFVIGGFVQLYHFRQVYTGVTHIRFVDTTYTILALITKLGLGMAYLIGIDAYTLTNLGDDVVQTDSSTNFNL